MKMINGWVKVRRRRRGGDESRSSLLRNSRRNFQHFRHPCFALCCSACKRRLLHRPNILASLLFIFFYSSYFPNQASEPDSRMTKATRATIRNEKAKEISKTMTSFPGNLTSREGLDSAFPLFTVLPFYILFISIFHHCTMKTLISYYYTIERDRRRACVHACAGQAFCAQRKPDDLAEV